MSEKEFALQLKKTIEEIKENGTSSIYCDNLISYLNEVINSPSQVVSEADLEKYRAELQLWVEQNKDKNTSRLELFKSVITSGQNAIKSSFLLNGGAAVATLAFIGKLTEIQQSLIPNFAYSLTIFVSGVLVVTMASGFTYLSQLFYAGLKPYMIKIGLTFNILSILLGLSSYGIFMWGMYSAYTNFIKFA